MSSISRSEGQPYCIVRALIHFVTNTANELVAVTQKTQFKEKLMYGSNEEFTGGAVMGNRNQT